MKFKTLTILSIIVLSNYSLAQTDLIFKGGFEFVPRLNDTGITWTGDFPEGALTECGKSESIPSPQDCNVGRDFTHNDDSDGFAGFSFTKLDDSGNPLSDQSVDYQTTPWACVRDNVTGLVWEVKTNTTGIHHKDNTYQWRGLTAIGRDHPDREGHYLEPSWNKLVQGSNDNTFCGFNDWRVPTVSELWSLMMYSLTSYAIDLNYFPNTKLKSYKDYWSSTPFAVGGIMAWEVNYGLRSSYYSERAKSNHVRLVRSSGR